jgi:hypothetical protein
MFLGFKIKRSLNDTAVITERNGNDMGRIMILIMALKLVIVICQKIKKDNDLLKSSIKATPEFGKMP